MTSTSPFLMVQSALRARDLRPWTLMIVQKLQLNGQPRPASKLVRMPAVRVKTSTGRYGVGTPSSPGRSLAAIGGSQQLVEASLRFTGEERDAELHRVAKLRRNVRQHREATADVKPADADRDPGGDERPGDVHGARELVGLHADEADEPPSARRADLPDDRVGPDAGVGLVLDGDADLDVLAQHPPRGAVEREPVQRRQRVRRDRRSEPLDDIALIIVVGGLNQEQLEYS